jgi:hypothetical protein
VWKFELVKFLELKLQRSGESGTVVKRHPGDGEEAGRAV